MTLLVSTWRNTSACEACHGTGSVARGRRGYNDPDTYAEHCTTCDGSGEIITRNGETRRQRVERFLDFWIDACGWAVPFYVAVQVGEARFPMTWDAFSDAGLETLAQQLARGFWRRKREARQSRAQYATRAA